MNPMLELPRNQRIYLTYLVCVLTCSLMIHSASVDAQPVGKRAFLTKGYDLGLPVYVKIEVTGPPGDIIVVEIPPEGWHVDTVYFQGKLNHGVICWDLNAFSGIKRLAYTVYPARFMTGNAFFSGKVGSQTISGVTVLPPTPIRPVGLFQNHLDIGPTVSGEVEYDGKTQEYRIQGGGNDQSLDLHFLYSEMDRSFCLRAQIDMDSIHGSSHLGLLGLMVRDNLANDAGFGMVCINRDHELGTLWSDSTWYLTSIEEERENSRSASNFDGWLELKRESHWIHLSYYDNDSQTGVILDQRYMELTDPVYVGLAVLSLDSHGRIGGTFSHVNLMPLMNEIGTYSNECLDTGLW